MATLLDVAALLAQVQTPTPSPTPAPLSVELIGGGTPWWQPFVVPLATLVAALGGVIIGGKINRDTIKSLEQERATREDARDEDKRGRDAAAERRLAVASLRLVREQMETAASNREVESTVHGLSVVGSPVLPQGMEAPFDVRAEDKHVIASWVTRSAWSQISRGISSIESLPGYRMFNREEESFGHLDHHAYREEAERHAVLLKEIVEVVYLEETRLASGDEG